MRFNPWWLGGLAAVAAWCFLATVSGAEAHGGVAPGQNVWTAWSPNPLPAFLVFLAAYLYLKGLRNWERPSHPVNRWQRASFFAGLLAIFIALQSPVDALSDHLFSIHQIQHALLRMIGPLLILLGAPMTPMLRGLPSWALRGGVRPLVGNPRVRRGYELLTNPVCTTTLYVGTLYLFQSPVLHNLALRSDAFHEVMHSAMLFTGMLFWWVVIDPKPHRSRLHYALRILYLGLGVIPNTLLGAFITFNSGLLYEAYGEVEQISRMSLLTDQQMGGLVLWVVGDMMNMMAAGIVMIMWYQREMENDRRAAAALDLPGPHS
ncbi:MAG: cytochrome c oxidase assembly protein [Dehalococcoidia bacterium]|nr:cytochrome c oxidase assembly protein [Dehalococcoidia bacterium]MSQ17351.1 cytochrome c oxidase assembly protein [Dehalococcoidia bacterium]